MSQSNLLDQFTNREKFMFLCGYSSGNMSGMLAILREYDPEKAQEDIGSIVNITNQILDLCNEKMNLDIQQTEELDYGISELTDEINELVVSLTKPITKETSSLTDCEGKN